MKKSGPKTPLLVIVKSKLWVVIHHLGIGKYGIGQSFWASQRGPVGTSMARPTPIVAVQPSFVFVWKWGIYPQI